MGRIFGMREGKRREGGDQIFVLLAGGCGLKLKSLCVAFIGGGDEWRRRNGGDGDGCDEARHNDGGGDGG